MRFRLIEDVDDRIDVAGRKWRKDGYQFFKDGKMWHHSQAGDQLDAYMRVYRKSPKWNLYINSFPRAALPFSVYFLANKETGDVYSTEVSQGYGNSDYIKDVVDWMNDRYEPPKITYGKLDSLI